MEKMTKRDMFVEFKAMFETGTCGVDAETAIAFCEKEIASLDAKAAKAKERAAAKKAESDALLALIEETLTDEFETIADITAKVVETDSEATVGKVTNRLTKLVSADIAEKTELTIPGKDGAKARKVKGFRIKQN